MEQQLPALCNYEQDNCIVLIPLAEFAYNNSVHHSTRTRSLWANYSYHPAMLFKPLKAASNIRSARLVDPTEPGMEETHPLHRDSVLDAEVRQSKDAGRKELTFEIGNKVQLSTRILQMTRLLKQLDYKRILPYMVSKIIKNNHYIQVLPKTMQSYHFFH
jgi:hypothetical protein